MFDLSQFTQHFKGFVFGRADKTTRINDQHICFFGIIRALVAVTHQQLRHRIRIDCVFCTTKGNKVKDVRFCHFCTTKFFNPICYCDSFVGVLVGVNVGEAVTVGEGVIDGVGEIYGVRVAVGDTTGVGTRISSGV